MIILFLALDISLTGIPEGVNQTIIRAAEPPIIPLRMPRGTAQGSTLVAR